MTIACEFTKATGLQQRAARPPVNRHYQQICLHGEVEKRGPLILQRDRPDRVDRQLLHPWQLIEFANSGSHRICSVRVARWKAWIRVCADDNWGRRTQESAMAHEVRDAAPVSVSMKRHRRGTHSRRACGCVGPDSRHTSLQPYVHFQRKQQAAASTAGCDASRIASQMKRCVIARVYFRTQFAVTASRSFA